MGERAGKVWGREGVWEGKGGYCGGEGSVGLGK